MMYIKINIGINRRSIFRTSRFSSRRWSSSLKSLSSSGRGRPAFSTTLVKDFAIEPGITVVEEEKVENGKTGFTWATLFIYLFLRCGLTAVDKGNTGEDGAKNKPSPESPHDVVRIADQDISPNSRTHAICRFSRISKNLEPSSSVAWGYNLRGSGEHGYRG
jgi:hypothetical protein